MTASTGEPAREVTDIQQVLSCSLTFQQVPGHRDILGLDGEGSETAMKKVRVVVDSVSPLSCDQLLGCFIRQLELI